MSVRSEKKEKKNNQTSPYYAPCRNSGSSSTLNAANLAGSTPCRPSTWTLAREKPHCGASGVPFMKSTTGAAATALSIACRVASESRRRCAASERRKEEDEEDEEVNPAGRRRGVAEAAAWRSCCYKDKSGFVSFPPFFFFFFLFFSGVGISVSECWLTLEKIVRANIFANAGGCCL